MCHFNLGCSLNLHASGIISQSLSTLSVIEEFLVKRLMPLGKANAEGQSQNWVRNVNYYSECPSFPIDYFE